MATDPFGIDAVASPSPVDPAGGAFPPSATGGGAASGQAGVVTAPQTSQQQQQQQQPMQQLCASCDRCRARKTKCDGQRPCGNCATRYRKVNKCETIDGVDLSAFDCVYSPAKRRGPIPGRASHRNAAALKLGSPPPGGYGVMNQNVNENMPPLGPGGLPGTAAPPNSNIAPAADFSSNELKQMLALQQQLMLAQQQMQQQQMHQEQQRQQQLQMAASMGNVDSNGNLQQVINNITANTNGPTAATVGSMGGGSNLMIGSGNVATTPSAFTLNAGLLNSSANTFQNFPNLQQQPQLQQLFPQQQQTGQFIAQNLNDNDGDDRSSKRVFRADPVQSSSHSAPNFAGLPNSVANHLPLLQPTNRDGSLLRSYFELSTNEILNLPPIPTDEEYCKRLNCSLPSNLPTYDHSALQAARFSELALGALANCQVPLALELSNASVMCLRNCVEEPSHTSCMYEVARAYLLHGIFRSFRGDSVRYFKYRRICLTHITQMTAEPDVEALLAAISFHDAWAYLMHNATENALPDIDESLPRLNQNFGMNQGENSECARGGCINPSSVATDPVNQMWMQGSPPVFLNNEACPVSRSLDAFACAVRTCCDEANRQFEGMAKASGMEMPGMSSTSASPDNSSVAGMTPTTTAVMANENELCSRNIVLSAKTLLDQHFGASGKIKKHGLTMIGSAMSAFLVDGQDNQQEGNAMGGFTDGQMKNLFAACDIIIQHPLLLHSPGPVYHMASNAAIMLCHLLNGIYANNSGGFSSKAKSTLFDEVLDAFMAVRKVLNNHRKNLPVKLRCHGIPRPSGGPFKQSNPGAPFIDLGDTLMCICRGCQGFVLMGCSPCVAAERSMKAAKTSKQEQWTDADNEFKTQIGDMNDLNLSDDDALLDVLSRIVQN